MTELLTINVKEFSKAAVHVILVFIYTTELNVTDGNVGEVLNCASELRNYLRQEQVYHLPQ